MTSEKKISGPTDEPRPTLQPPKVHTMGMGHLPLTVLVTGAVSFIFALAFRLGMAPALASLAILMLLYGLSALVPSPKSMNGQTAEPAAKTLTTGTRFTILRITITSLLGGLAIIPTTGQPDLMLWAMAALGLLAALLETTDNWLARLTSSVSRFSERLSTMTSSMFSLALALLPWQLGLIGTWVLAAGILGFAESAISAKGTQGEVAPWQMWSRLSMRVLLLAVLAPIVPEALRPLFAGLAVAIALAHVVYALYRRSSASK